MNDINFKRAARKSVFGTYRSICIKRSWNAAHTNWSTPVRIIEGDAAPEVEGQPYLKTTFNNHKGFIKVLYTYSTLKIVVGKDWQP